MSQQFTLTAQLRLQPPTNIGQVVNQMRNQIGGITVDLRVQSQTRQLDTVQKQLNSVKKAAGEASKGVTNFGEQAALAAKRFFAFSIATTGFLKLVNAIGNGVKDAIEFEREVFKISQVTGTAIRDLKDLTGEVDRLSKTLGVSSSKLLNVAQVLAQAGLQADDIKKSLEALAKTDLSATFDDLGATGEGVIAIFAQFGVKADQLENKLSGLNSVAGKFAVESSDLITAVRRTGGAFQAAGGSLEELVALFTSVRATTRESAESIATGFRTIFTRLQRIRTVNFLSNIGVQLRDFEGQFVGPFEAIRRLSGALNDIPSTDPRFAQVIEELGGFRQISKVIPLIQKFGEAQKALIVAQQGQGSLARDAAQAQGSLAVQLAKVNEEFSALVRKITNDEAFKGIINLTTKLATAFIRVVDAATPLIPLIAGIGGIKVAGLAKSFVTGFASKGLPFSTGGLVPGSGSGDTVPARLEPGEYVLRKSAVKALGLGGARTLNKARGGAILGRKYAKGGIVEPSDFEGLQEVIQKARLNVDYPRGNDTASRDAFFSKALRDNFYTDKNKVSDKYLSDIVSSFIFGDSPKVLKKINKLQKEEIEKAARQADKNKALEKYDILLPPKSELEFGAVYLNRSDLTKELGLYEPKTTMISNVDGFKGKRVPVQLKYHQAAMSQNTAKNFIDRTKLELPEVVKNVASTIAPDFGATEINTLQRVPGQDSIAGFLFEGALQSLGGPYSEINDDSRRFDFPYGLGKLGSIFKGLPANRPVDAKLTEGTQNQSLIDKARSKLVEKYSNLFQGFNKGGLVQHFATGGAVEGWDSIGGDTPRKNLRAVSQKDIKRTVALLQKRTGIDFTKAYNRAFTGPFSKIAENPGNNHAALVVKQIKEKFGSTDNVGGFFNNQSRDVVFNEDNKLRPKERIELIAHELFHALDFDPETKTYGTEVDPTASGFLASAQRKAQFQAQSGKFSEDYTKYFTSSKEVGARAFASDVITHDRDIKKLGDYGAILEARVKQANIKTVLKSLKQRRGFAKGGSVTDTVPAMLTPGEFVITKDVAQKIGYSNLDKANKAKGYAKGGIVGKPTRFSGGGTVPAVTASNFDNDPKFKALEKVSVASFGAATALQTLTLYMGDTNTQFSKMVGLIANVTTQFGVYNGLLKTSSGFFQERKIRQSQSNVESTLSKPINFVKELTKKFEDQEKTVDKDIGLIKEERAGFNQALRKIAADQIKNDPILSRRFRQANGAEKTQLFNDTIDRVSRPGQAGARQGNLRNQANLKLESLQSAQSVAVFKNNKILESYNKGLIKARDLATKAEQAKLDRNSKIESGSQIGISVAAAALGVGGEFLSNRGSGQIASGNFASGRSNLQTGGALSGAATGLAAGAALGSFGGPAGIAIGAAVGGAAGAIIGYNNAIVEATRQIESVKFSEAFKKFAKQLNSGLASVGDINTFSGKAENRLFSTTGDDFQTSLANLESSALQLDQALSKQAGKFKTADRTTAELNKALEAFKASLDPATIRIFGKATNSSTDEVNKRFREMIKTATDLSLSHAKLNKATQNVYLDMVKLNNIEKIFNDSLQSMAESLDRANTALDPFSVKVSDSFSGNINNPGASLDPSIFTKAINGGLLPILQKAVPNDAQNIADRALNAQKVIAAIPDALARSRTIGTSDDPIDTVLSNLEATVGSEFSSAIRLALQGVLGSEGKPENLINALEQDFLGLADKLGDTVTKSAGLDSLSKASSTYVKILNDVIDKNSQILAAENELTGLRLKGIDIQSQFNEILRKVDDPRTRNNFGEVERLARQRTLVGSSVAPADIFTPNAIASQALSAFSAIQAEQQKGVNLDPAVLANLNRSLSQSVAGLENLADVSSQLAPELARLEEATRKQGQARGFIDSIIGGGTNARQGISGLAKTIQTVSQFNTTGNIGQLAPQNANQILGVLGQFPDLLKSIPRTDPDAVGTAIRKQAIAPLENMLNTILPGNPNEVKSIVDFLSQNIGKDKIDGVITQLEKVVARGQKSNELLSDLKQLQVNIAQAQVNAASQRSAAQVAKSAAEAGKVSKETELNIQKNNLGGVNNKIKRISDAAALSGVDPQTLLDNKDKLQSARDLFAAQKRRSSLTPSQAAVIPSFIYNSGLPATVNQNKLSSSLSKKNISLSKNAISSGVGTTDDIFKLADLFAQSSSSDVNVQKKIKDELISKNTAGVQTADGKVNINAVLGNFSSAIQDILNKFKLEDTKTINDNSELSKIFTKPELVANNFEQIEKLLNGIEETNFSKLTDEAQKAGDAIKVLATEISALKTDISNADDNINQINDNETQTVNDVESALVWEQATRAAELEREKRMKEILSGVIVNRGGAPVDDFGGSLELNTRTVPTNGIELERVSNVNPNRSLIQPSDYGDVFERGTPNQFVPTSTATTGNTGNISTVFGEISKSFAEELRAVFNQDLIPQNVLTSFDGLTTALNNFPRNVEHNFTGTLNVLVNGAEAFAAMKPEMEKLVMTKITDSLNKMLQKNFKGNAGHFEANNEE